MSFCAQELPCILGEGEGVRLANTCLASRHMQAQQMVDSLCVLSCCGWHAVGGVAMGDGSSHLALPCSCCAPPLPLSACPYLVFIPIPPVLLLLARSVVLDAFTQQPGNDAFLRLMPTFR